MGDSVPNDVKLAALTFAELTDQHASVTRILNSKLTALEAAKKEIAELERQKECMLSELLVRMKRMAAKMDEVEKNLNAPMNYRVSETEAKQLVENAAGTKQSAVKHTDRSCVEPLKIVNVKAEPAIPGNGQSEAKKNSPRSVPVKHWERHRCMNPYKTGLKLFDNRAPIGVQIVTRRVAFGVNTCTFKTVKRTADFIVTALSEFILSDGGVSKHSSTIACSMWSYIGLRVISDEMHTLTFVTLQKELLLRFFARSSDIALSAVDFMRISLSFVIKASKSPGYIRSEKQIIVNIMRVLGEVQKHGYLKRKEMIDVFSDALLPFDQNNCGFARRILAKLYKSHERGLWCISEGYSEDDENRGKPVTPPVTRIHLKPRELLPVAVDRGCFGETLKSAPIELKTLVGWLFVQFPTVPRLDRDLTVFLNSISHKDLQIKRYEAINSSAQRALSDEERLLLPEKMLTALVVRALTSPLKSTSLYVRLLTETGKNFVSLGLMSQKRVEELHSESIFVLVHTVLVAAIIWQRGGRKLELCLGDCPLKVRQQLSKFFAKISEHGFYRVAWFLFCLRNHGKAQSSQIKDLRTRLCIDTRPNHTKFRLLSEWLHGLDRSGFHANSVGSQESPLNLEENFGSSDHCRRCSG